MNELTLKFNIYNWINPELKEYLLTVKGILEIKINDKTNEIYIKYDNTKISIKLVMWEIHLFIDEFLILINFNKHAKKKTSTYNMSIEKFCCEHCLNSIMEELLLTDGIETATNNFIHIKEDSITIIIKYDENEITEKELKPLKEQFIKLQYIYQKKN